MFALPGYQILHKLHSTPAFSLYRIRRLSDNGEFLLRQQTADSSDSINQQRAQQEAAVADLRDNQRPQAPVPKEDPLLHGQAAGERLLS